jgi:hypothetical protein
MDGIRTGQGRPGTLGEGLRWAEADGCRLVAYPPSERAGEGGGYSTQHYVPGVGWCIANDVPEGMERALCEALGLEYVWDDRCAGRGR